MSRHNQKQRSLKAAQYYISAFLPELCECPLDIHVLDGPPEGPRYAVAVESCSSRGCPYGFGTHEHPTAQCAVLDCPLRCSARLLLDRDGTVLHTTISGIHWK
jgi:hypothetical protein